MTASLLYLVYRKYYIMYSIDKKVFLLAIYLQSLDFINFML